MKMGTQRRLLAVSDMPPQIDARHRHARRVVVARHHRCVRHAAVCTTKRRDAGGRAGADGRRLPRDRARRSAAAQGDAALLGQHPAAVAGRSPASPRRWSIFALHYLLVRPMRRITANMMAFRADPENPARIIAASGRSDEIGTAERELAAMQRDLASMLQQKNRLAALGLAVSKINHDLRNLLSSAQLFSDRLSSLPDPNVQRFAPKLMRALERAIAFCQSTLSYGARAGAAARPQADRARAAGRGGARDARPRARRADPLDRRGRARPDGRCRSRPAVPRPAQSRAQRGAGAGERAAPNDPARDQIRITGRREGAVVVIEVSDTGPGFSEQGARASVRGVPGLDPHRRHRARPRHRRRTGARPWRRDPPGRGHHRRDLPPHHSRPRGRAQCAPRRAGERLSPKGQCDPRRCS